MKKSLEKQQAIDMGLIKYTSKKPCKRGHFIRYVNGNSCVECMSLRQKTDEVKQYKANNYLLNKDIALIRAKEHYENNKEEKRQYSSEYQKKNLKKIQERRNRRKLNDPIYALKHRVRQLIGVSIKGKGYTKRSKTFLILGCTFEYFKNHIEKQFTKGMNWENFGEWHLDHIIPMANAKSEEDIIAFNHFTNFRPLWAKDNLQKSSKNLFLT